MAEHEEEAFVLDLDRDRIHTILGAAYRTLAETLNPGFMISEDLFVDSVNKYLDSNRVAIPVQLCLPSRKYPDLKIEEDLRRRKLTARMYNAKQPAKINHLIRIL